MTNNTNKEQIQHRVVEKQEYDGQLIEKLLSLLNLQANGEINNVEQGRIATNITLNTSKGLILIRIYPKEMPKKLETGNPLFEIRALEHYSNNNIKVPKLLLIDNKPYYKTDNQIIFIYLMLEGRPIEQKELSVELATNIGIFLGHLLPIAAAYNNDINSLNTFKYVLENMSKTENLYPELKELNIWLKIKTNTISNQDIINNTPDGIVHADYFFENILIDPNNRVTGLIDFGDAYYGKLLHDITIGAMEASIIDEKWDLKKFSAFLQGVSSFLQINNISFSQFIETLKLDCARFSVYTIPFTVEENQELKLNPYLNRYEKLLSNDFVTDLNQIYTQCIGNHTDTLGQVVPIDTL